MGMEVRRTGVGGHCRAGRGREWSNRVSVEDGDGDADGFAARARPGVGELPAGQVDPPGKPNRRSGSP